MTKGVYEQLRSYTPFFVLKNMHFIDIDDH